MTIAPKRRLANRLFGKPTLHSGGSGIAAWGKATALGQHQKGHSGILAHLYGGSQSGDDWAACYIPVDELPVPELAKGGEDLISWTWYQTNTETMGLGMVVWMHDPANTDNRAEVTQLANVSGLDKAAGWNSHEFDKTTTQMFYYGENVSGSKLTAGTQYAWTSFQSDSLFKNWTIYRISFDWGWDASGTYESAWLAEVKLNGQNVLLDPSFVEFDITTSIGNGRATCTAAGTPNQFTTTTTPCKWIDITAETDNSGAVVVGGGSGSTLDETQASRTGRPLLAGDNVVLPVDDVSKLYIDAATSGDGVTYVFGY